METPLKIFLSYAPAERDLAKELKTRLEREGYAVWFADDELLLGDNWLLKAGQALGNSNAMIVLLSPEYLSLPWALNQALFAIGSMNYEHRVIPVLVRATKEFRHLFDALGVIRVGRNWQRAVKQILDRLHEAAGVAQ